MRVTSIFTILSFSFILCGTSCLAASTAPTTLKTLTISGVPIYKSGSVGASTYISSVSYAGTPLTPANIRNVSVFFQYTTGAEYKAEMSGFGCHLDINRYPNGGPYVTQSLCRDSEMTVLGKDTFANTNASQTRSLQFVFTYED